MEPLTLARGAAEETLRGTAMLEGADTTIGTRPHASLAAAVEALGAVRGPLFTLHQGASQEPVPGIALREGARRWARHFLALGLERHDRVVLLLPTSRDFLEAFLGVSLAGGAAVPLAGPMTFGSSARYLEHLGHVVRDAEPRFLVTTPRMVDELRAVSWAATSSVRVMTPDEVSSSRARGPALPSVDPEDLALLQYTSGTTGRPKGVAIPHRALTANAAAIHHALHIGRDEVGVSWLPLFHDMGLIGVFVTGVCHPYPVHLMAPETFIMQPRRWLERISSVGATLSAAPNFAYELAVRRGADPSATRLHTWTKALSGAEPVREGTMRRFAERYAPSGFSPTAVTPVYGLAEATLAVTMTATGAGLSARQVDPASLEVGGRAREARGTGASSVTDVGRPVAGTRVRITDDQGRTLLRGDVGEIRVAGPSVMRGYFRNDDATAHALEDGWLRTGDLGFVDEGDLYVVGRSKDVIIKSGRNIHPADVEGVVEGLDEVVAAAAFGVPNEATGTEDLVVACETRERDPDRRAALEKQVVAELLTRAGVKADAVALWSLATIPRTTSGKVRRNECARRWRDGGTA